MAYGFKNDISNLVNFHAKSWMLDKSTVYVLAEGMYFLDTSSQIYNQELVFCINFAPLCNILAKT